MNSSYQIHEWDNKLIDLRNYIFQHGHFPHQRDGGLGMWASFQRFEFRMNNMIEERRSKWEEFTTEIEAYLADIQLCRPEFELELEKKMMNGEWESYFQRLQVFVVLNGRLPICNTDTLDLITSVEPSVSAPSVNEPITLNVETELALWYYEEMNMFQSRRGDVLFRNLINL